MRSTPSVAVARCREAIGNVEQALAFAEVDGLGTVDTLCATLRALHKTLAVLEQITSPIDMAWVGER